MQISKQWILGSALIAAVGCGDHDATDAGNDVPTAQDVVVADTTPGTDATSDVMTTTGPVNGCMDADYVDMSSMAAVTVTFTGVAYTPKCLTVSTGTVVTFSGMFATHPLAPGVAPSVTGSAPSSDGNPITATSTGTSAPFTFAAAGTFGYYCTVHQTAGMVGAIRVH